MILRIYDASNYIYAGYFGNRRGIVVNRGVREVEGMWCDNSFPAHGAIFLLKNIFDLSNENTISMAVFDRTPTIKRQMYYEMTGDEYGYKGTRENDPNVTENIKFQKKLAEALCRKADICVQAVDGYEADDIIHTLVNMYRDEYEHIYIHTKDSDLAYLVSDNVSIAQVGDKGKIINMENYEFTARSKITTEYNTVHLNKLIKGDTADNIPGIGPSWAKFINKYITLENVRELGDLNMCRDILRKAVKDNFESPNSHRVLPTFNLIVPLTVPYDSIDEYEHETNCKMIDRYFLSGFREEDDMWDCESLILQFLEIYNDLNIS